MQHEGKGFYCTLSIYTRGDAKILLIPSPLTMRVHLFLMLWYATLFICRGRAAVHATANNT